MLTIGVIKRIFDYRLVTYVLTLKQKEVNKMRVSIINAGSMFRGLIGTVDEISPSGLYVVTFDVPYYGITSSLFFSNEIASL